MPDLSDLLAQAKIAKKDIADLRLQPLLTSWSRLEPLTVTSGDLTPGAQALVADPLWMIGRQWQFDELTGEDAGTPILATVRGESGTFSRLRNDGGASDIPPPGESAPPLEALVEAELPPVLPLRLRTQAGLHLLRMLRAAGLTAEARAAIDAYAPAGRGDARERLAAGRVPDSAAVLAALAGFDDGNGGLTGLPDSFGAAPAAATTPVVAGWQRWVSGFLVAPAGDSWNPHRLEHSFAAEATLSDGPVALHVDEYTGGTLDWFHGDLTGAAVPSPPGTTLADTTLPTPVRFAGMPSDRLFEFEDARVYLGDLEAGRTDLARLATVEFALTYSVDWFQVPLIVPYGTATRIDTVHVVDTFGVDVDVHASRETGWGVFRCTPLTDRSRLADIFVLAPTIPRVLEGLPLEEVALFRDEMANLVWGVERIVPDAGTGEPVPRAQQAAAMPAAAVPGDARLHYRLMTSVPENWIPYVAVPQRSHPVLERRPMLRYLDDGTAQVVDPLGTILPAAATIAEEEVPREGVLVTRTFQQARTVGGGTALWIGRRVTTGHGEGASGLRFDLALPPL
ncbi:hypothetical protein [Winogradskya humida]|uniref:Tail protein P2 I n=1 Tax=Winogradskya humida TaxID=113566 RepID=A0ABQ3ZYH7_9ACTN|nr:hypothetical protein [Actinoplanes humidus]GIE23645.1 hypothetical protein Ahu01nite_067470 [Actinoplanes humidus]